MKYTFIGDIHGKVEAVEQALEKEGKKIFVGDFIDSFDRNIKEHEKCYQLVLDSIDKGESEVLYGNHELSYMMPSQRCSGWQQDRATLMSRYLPELKKRFKYYLILGDRLLISHAGLTKQLWDDSLLSLDLLDRVLTDWIPDEHSPMYHIGYSRGGRDHYGGLFWCDYNCEFEPIPGLSQIFGHTPGVGIRMKNGNYCIDCLDKANKDGLPYTFLQMEIPE